MFPDKNQYLKMPKLLEEQRRLNEYYGRKYVDGETLDPRVGPYLETADMDDLVNKVLEANDVPHPSDGDRTFLGDLDEGLDQIRKRWAARGMEADEGHAPDISRLMKKLQASYHPAAGIPRGMDEEARERYLAEQ